jgi:CheY-like chemotaxis protein
MVRILVVEDDVWSRRLVIELLEYRGHEVVCADTVDDGREQLARGAPDAVLLDLHIPGGGGERLLEGIRAHDAALPVIAFTGAAMVGDRERFLAAGFSGHIAKPIDVRTFAATIEAYVATRGP